jgi:Zn-dependent protease with chaperone function
MRLILSSVLLGLAWFAAVNILVTPIAWMLARTALQRKGASGASALFAIRLLPSIASCLFVFALFLPAHWRFEERNTQESFGILIASLAALGLALFGRSVWRAIRVSWNGYRLASLARKSASRLVSPGAFEVAGVPGVSLAGILRPQVLIGSEALRALTPAELDVAISHEIAHRRSGDNLKRFVMFCAPDLFGWLPAARQLENQWLAEAECQADDHAVMGDDTRAVALASALVKVAQLRCRAGLVLQSAAWSAFHVPTLLETRVRRLVSEPLTAPARSRRQWGSVAAVAIAVPLGVWLLGFSHTLHVVTEAMVTYLP